MHTVALSDGATSTLVVAGAIASIAGALALLAGALWLASLLLPEVLWATVKRLPYGNEDAIDRTACTIAMSRKAWCLRIPRSGIRLVLSVGGDLERQTHLMDDLHTARRLRRDREELADANS